MTTTPDNTEPVTSQPQNMAPGASAPADAEAGETDAERDARLAQEQADQEADLKRMAELMPGLDFADEDSALKTEIASLESSVGLTQSMIINLKVVRDGLQATFDKSQQAVADLEDAFKKRQKEAARQFGCDILPIFDALNAQLSTITADERKTSSQADKIITSLQKSCSGLKTEMQKFGVGVAPAQPPAAKGAPADAAPAAAEQGETPVPAATADEQPEDLHTKRARLEAQLSVLTKEQRTLGGEQAQLKKRIEDSKATLENRKRILEKNMGLAIEKIAQQVLPVADTAEKNFALISDQQRAEIPVMDKVSGHLSTTLKSLSDAFNKHGITPVNPIMQAFDENRHEALSTVEKDGVDPGTVVSVMRTGYMLKDHVLRTAQVLVTPN